MSHFGTRSGIAGGVILLAALCGISSIDALASDAQRVRNQEYRFSVTFPAGAHVCTATSGDQPHGFFVRLVDSHGECNRIAENSGVSVISVYAYSNATFEDSPEKAISGLCPVGGTDKETGALKSLRLGERHSAQCQLQRADGSIDIYVVAQAGQWPGAHESQELEVPYVNYTASLHTTQDRMSEDLKAFRIILESVCIEYSQ